MRRDRQIAALAGALHAILFLASWWLLTDVPGPGATHAEIVDHYGRDSSRRETLGGLYLMPFAGIAFVWFIVALRMWVDETSHRKNILMWNVNLVSGIVYIALFFGGAAAFSVAASSVEFVNGQLDPEVARQFPVYGINVIFVFAFRMAAMFVLTSSALLLRAGVLPRWFAWSGYAVGAFLLLSASFERWFVLIFPIWLLVLSALLLRDLRRTDPELRQPARCEP